MGPKGTKMETVKTKKPWTVWTTSAAHSNLMPSSTASPVRTLIQGNPKIFFCLVWAVGFDDFDASGRTACWTLKFVGCTDKCGICKKNYRYHLKSLFPYTNPNFYLDIGAVCDLLWRLAHSNGWYFQQNKSYQNLRLVLNPMRGRLGHLSHTDV